MSGNSEHKRLQETANDGHYARECRARWESERNARWVEDPSGRLWPRPGFEPSTFTDVSRMQRDNALKLERERKLCATPVSEAEKLSGGRCLKCGRPTGRRDDVTACGECW